MAAETPMARMLAVLNGGEVGRRLGVSRNAVSEWGRMARPPAGRVDQVREIMLQALGDNEEAAWPEWARQLDKKMNAMLIAVGVDPLDDVIGEVAGTGEPPVSDEAHPEGEHQPARADEPQ